MTAKRLPGYGLIDRERPIAFEWDGRQLSGFTGDTLASALLANNAGPIGRSFKYHRPRGVMSAGVEEAGALVTIATGGRQTPNLAATTVELSAGLQAFGQNAWPNVRVDFGAISDRFNRFFAAGFYYKTFMGIPPFEWGRGTGMWMRFEHLIRRAAGMGALPMRDDPDRYEHRQLHCDLLVVGAGPAGLVAATKAAQAGLHTVLLEQDFALGGHLMSGETIGFAEQRDKLIAETLSAGVRILTRTTCLGLYDSCTALAVELLLTDPVKPSTLRERIWNIAAGHIVLATGAIERQFVFHHNDLPGIMSASAANIYLNRYGVLGGHKVVIATNNDSAYATAHNLAKAGATVTVVDCRPKALVNTASGSDFESIVASRPMRSIGSRHVTGTEIINDRGQMRRLDCDLLLVSGGWSPALHLLSHRGVKPVWCAERTAFLPGQTHESISYIGALAGVFDHQASIETAEHVAEQIIKAPYKPAVIPSGDCRTGWRTPLSPLYEVKGGKGARCFVDPVHDVTAKDVRLAHQEGFVSVEHLKRYTTLGMGGDQGKVGNIIGMALMADALGVGVAEVGVTTFRPPYTPVSISALAGNARGHHVVPLRRTPLHDWHERRSAVMTEAGLWHRPWWYPENGGTLDDASYREAATVRETVGMCDVSTLGKIKIQGPDALEFINRIFVNGMASLPVGRTRYGVLLRDDGIVMDDGVVWRLAEHSFFLTTTSAHSARLFDWLDYLRNCRWPELKVSLHSQTDQWAALAVAGPRSRDVLSSVFSVDFVNAAALPFMHFIQTETQNGLQCRIARVSFSGERAYEIYAPADYGEHLADCLEQAVREQGGCLYGLEALDVLRIEKGHVADGEIDGNATLSDLGLSKMASKTKVAVGGSLAGRPALQDGNRPRLVGVIAEGDGTAFSGGAILCEAGTETGHGQGWITVAAASPAVKAHIGLAFISGGHEKWADRRVVALDPVRGRRTSVKIVAPVMFDPDSRRLQG